MVETVHVSVMDPLLVNLYQKATRLTLSLTAFYYGWVTVLVHKTRLPDYRVSEILPISGERDTPLGSSMLDLCLGERNCRFLSP